MVRYIRTNLDADLIKDLIKRHLDINKYIAINAITDKEKKFIADTYNININKIIAEFINQVRVGNIKDDLLQVYILDKDISNTRLNKLLSLLEYGNRNIKQTKSITRMLNKSVKEVKNYLEGE